MGVDWAVEKGKLERPGPKARSRSGARRSMAGRARGDSIEERMLLNKNRTGCNWEVGEQAYFLIK